MQSCFHLVPYQDAPSPPMTEALRLACQKGIHVIRTDGGVLREGRAVLYILERTGWGVSARLLAYPPLLWLVQLGYLLVARNRRFFSRFLFRRE